MEGKGKVLSRGNDWFSMKYITTKLRRNGKLTYTIITAETGNVNKDLSLKELLKTDGFQVGFYPTFKKQIIQ